MGTGGQRGRGMTEEIIIDGVRVDECSYYNEDNEPYCCDIWDNECEAQNCYYKQLQRLKQENEKQRKALEEIREIADKCKECLNEDDDCGCDYLRIVRKINEVLK